MNIFIAFLRKLLKPFLLPIANWFLKIGFSPNSLTFLSFLFGILAVFFLFNNHPLFILFGILTIFFDELDGVSARKNKISDFGKYFDSISDGTIALAIVLKFGMVYLSFLANLAFILYFISLSLFWSTKMKYFLFPQRTLILFMFFFQYYELAIESSILISFFSILILFYQSFFSFKRNPR